MKHSVCTCGMLSVGSKTSEMLDMLQWNARLRESKESGGSVGISPVTGRRCHFQRQATRVGTCLSSLLNVNCAFVLTG